jgi:hypothetical protein
MRTWPFLSIPVRRLAFLVEGHDDDGPAIPVDDLGLLYEILLA